MSRFFFTSFLLVFAVTGIFTQETAREGTASSEILIGPEQSIAEQVFYSPGDKGPGGGIVFPVGENSYMEVSQSLGFHSWDAAVKAAQNYLGGGFSDWRLPTKEELNLIYLNLRRKNLGALGDDIYWSSTQNDSGSAWYQSLGNGIQRSGNIRSFSLCVRAVRVF